MGVLLGLVAALCWGVGDYVARNVSRELGSYRALYYSQFFGLAVLTAYLVASGELARLTGASWQSWAWGVAAAVLVTATSVAFFRAFEIGVLALVAPLVASYGAVTAGLSILSGERLEAGTAAGLGLALLGVGLASVPPRSGRRRSGGRGLPPGVAQALVASVGYGVTFWLIGWRAAPELGGVAPIWLFRVVGPVALALCARPLGQSLAPIPGRAWAAVSAVGGLTLLAAVATGVGLGLGEITVVTVLGSLSTAVTAVLGWALLRERLAPHQWAGAGVILAGVVLVGL